MDPRTLARVLAEIADTASETLELQQVVDRVATSVRDLVPFDNLGVVRILPGERAVVHATTVRSEGCVESHWEPVPLTSWSPRIRPRPARIARVEDASQELDPDFPLDAEILAAGVRSSLWEPFRSRTTLAGGIWLSARRPRAFTDEHQEALRPVAALLGSVVEHWRMWDAERRRRERLERLETLAGSLAESLDVRKVVGRLAERVHPVLDHDLVLLTELAPDHASFRVVAAAGAAAGALPSGAVALTADEQQIRRMEFGIVRDAELDVEPDTERNRMLLATGMRSWLRLPVRSRGEVDGFLGFFHREPARYGADDVEIGRRLADRIALALSHARLAEEERIATEARDRAARLEATVESLVRELDQHGKIQVVGASRGWKAVLRQVGQVAGSDTTILVTGESGTGKEVVSRLIHQGSPRCRRPFVAINCAALPDQLLESELFGHEKGAFTGAVAAKAGRLEAAEGGTLFLDEIGEMSPLVQAKLLRFLQEREFQRLGGTRTLRSDVRLVTATNRDLAQAIARGQFREDLYYRLAVFEIRVPPLRDRPEDVLALADLFLAELGATTGRPAAGISRDARDWLLAYPWPGNVRELRNAIERAILLCDGGLIARDHLPAALGRPEEVRSLPGLGTALDPDTALPAGGVDLSEVERVLLEKALERTRGNKSQAARLLGLTRSQLYSKLDRHGLR